jgi:hypothetical protein
VLEGLREGHDEPVSVAAPVALVKVGAGFHSVGQKSWLLIQLRSDRCFGLTLGTILFTTLFCCLGAGAGISGTSAGVVAIAQGFLIENYPRRDPATRIHLDKSLTDRPQS